MGVRIVVYGVAQPGGSKTAVRTKSGKVVVRDASRGVAEWRKQVAQAAGEAMEGRPLLEGPLVLTVSFAVPRPRSHYGRRGLRPSAPVLPTTRPDLTKLLRAVEDALTGIVWRDDAQVVFQQASKCYDEPARVVIHVDPATSWEGLRRALA